jgi:hypothetical protein
MLARMLTEDDFNATLARVRKLREEVDSLDAAAATAVNSTVYGRVSWRPDTPDPPAGLEQLADEIHDLLEDTHLSPQQAAQLKRAYFGS